VFLINTGSSPQFICEKITAFLRDSTQGDVIPCLFSDACVKVVLCKKLGSILGSIFWKQSKKYLLTHVAFVVEVAFVSPP